ncbi:MAG: lipid II flippase MurJ [Xanthobacteraceae bacterium]
MPGRIAQTSVALVLITIVTAASGYLREFVLARTFGVGTEMDAFYFCVGLIQASHDLLFGATLTATIVPLLHRPAAAAPSAADDPARFTVTVALTIALLGIAVAIGIRGIMPDLIDLLSPDMSGVVRAQCLALSTLAVWLLPLNALTNVGVLVLNAHQRFVVPATSYIFINLMFVAVVVLFAPTEGLYSLSLAVVAGPACFLPVLAVCLARMGLLRALRPDFSRQFFHPIWRQARPILLSFGIGSSLGLLMIAHLIVRGFAADSGQGSIAALGYAFRLYQVPLSLLANPAAVLILPNIAILYQAGRIAEIREISRQLLLAGLVVLFPAAVVTWVGADLIVHLLLQRGSFDAGAARLTAEALRGFAPAIVVEGIIVVFYRFFYAIYRPHRVVFASFAALAALLCLLFLFGHITFINVPLSLSGGFLIGAAILIYSLKREIGRDGLPTIISLAKWACCVLVGMAGLRIAEHYETANLWTELIVIGVFLACYCAAVLGAFGDYRRMLFKLLGAFGWRLRRIVGSV